MKPPQIQPRDLFFVLEPFRHHVRRFAAVLAQLSTAEYASIIGISAYFRSETDIALVAVRLPGGAISAQDLGQLRALALTGGLPIMDTGELNPGDRQRFYSDHLARYELCVEGCRTALDALRELVRRVPLLDAGLGLTGPGQEPSRAVLATGSTPPSRNQLLPAWPGNDRTAPGNSDINEFSERAPTVPRPAGAFPPGEGPTAVVPRPPAEADLLKAAGLAAMPAPCWAELSGPTAVSPGGAAQEVLPAAAAAQTIPPAASRSPARPRRTLPATPIAKAHLNASVEVLPTTDEQAVHARFLRGEAWLPTRVRSLSTRRGFFATGAPPRRDDMVQLAIRYADTVATVWGIVTSVTSHKDAAARGAAGFAVEFPPGDGEVRQQLAQLLRRAAQAGVELLPPPRRESVRFPVRWPVRLATRDGRYVASALDVSSHGMFLAMRQALEAGDLVFRLPLDRNEGPIQGRARVAREIDPATARLRGLTRGYGVEICELPESATRSYCRFLERVSLRAARHVLIAADPERGRELATGLGSVGYAVTTATSGEVAQVLGAFHGRRPDVALLDGDELAISDCVDVLAAQQIPCIRTHLRPPQHARELVDSLLAVQV